MSIMIKYYVFIVKNLETTDKDEIKHGLFPHPSGNIRDN